MSARNLRSQSFPIDGVIRLLMLVAALLVCTGASDAATINVPGTYLTIQAAVNAANNGDTVLVAPGTYTAGADFHGKNITVKSSGGAGVTAIAETGSTSPVFTFDSGESSSAVLEGFEIEDSGAMFISDSSPTIKQCIFLDNTEASSVAGGAIYIEQDSAACDPAIEQCSFIGNSAPETGVGDGYGGAIGCLNFGFGEQNVDVINCVFYDNSSTDDGAAIDVSSRSGSTPVFNIVNCSFNNNIVTSPTTGSQNSGTIDNAEGVVNITNSIMWDDNTPSEYSTVYCPSQFGGSLNIQNSDIGGGFAGTSATDGGGNINSDPLFVTESGDDLRLLFNSPAINVGITGGLVPTVDINGNPRDPDPDLGAYEYVIQVTNLNINPGANAPFSGQVATFVDSTDLVSDVTSFSNATIVWGDGATDSGVGIFQPEGSGTPYVITGAHTYAAAGSYTLTVTVNANTNLPNVSGIDATNITVGHQTVTSLSVTPGPTLTLAPSSTQQFSATAYDQFGNPLLSQPTIGWNLVSGGVGSVSGAGLYHSGTVPGTATIKAKSGGVSTSVAVTVKLPSPVAPTLTATDGTAQVTLNWTASAGAQVYRVYRGTSAGGEGATPIKGGLTTTTFVDSNLPSGATYYYEVTAVNTGGASAFSNEASAVTAPIAPTLTATAGSAQVTLNWTASSGASVYRVYRATVSGGEGNSMLKGGITSASFTDTSATAGGTYYYKVTAVNTAGPSPLSNEAPATPSPAAPTLTATPGASQVTLNWTTSAGALVYRVYRGTTSGGEGTLPLKGGIASTSYTDTAVAAGGSYYYEVTAVSAAGASPVSNEAVATLTPAAPTLTATAGAAQVKLNWTASAGASVYRVYRSTVSEGEGSPPIKGGIAATSYTDTSAAAGVTYFYKVTAVNTGGASPYSNEAPAAPGPAVVIGSSMLPLNQPSTMAATSVFDGTLNRTVSVRTHEFGIYRSAGVVQCPRLFLRPSPVKPSTQSKLLVTSQVS